MSVEDEQAMQFEYEHASESRDDDANQSSKLNHLNNARM